MLPIGTVGRDRYNAVVVKTLILINAIVFVWEMLYLNSKGELAFLQVLMGITFNVCEIGITPLPNMALDGLRSMFLHGSLAHIAGNMMFLWIFGRKVEEYFGKAFFVGFYLLSGYMAIAGHTLLGQIACTTVTDGLLIGASGAVAGVMGAFLFLHPSVQIKTFLVAWTIRIPAIFFLVFWFVYDLLQGTSWFAGDADNVAHWAHVGGFLFGFIIVFITTMFFKPAPKADPFAYLDE